MSNIKEILKQYKEDYSKFGKYDMIFVSIVIDTIDDLLGALEQDEKENGWIPVTERLPEEHNSIFAKFKGTPAMFEKASKHVLVTVKYKKGVKLVKQAHTIDGKWKSDVSLMGGEVIAWMPFPEPCEED